MAKVVSPLLGFNNNVRHKNRVFHIQTEDSGINHPHIITHLFMDGGRILKSVKRSYAEHVGAEGMNEIVRQMMKDQHKAMFVALRDGQFDHLLETPPASNKGGAPTSTPATTHGPIASTPPSAAVSAPPLSAVASSTGSALAGGPVSAPAASAPVASAVASARAPVSVAVPSEQAPVTLRQPDVTTAKVTVEVDVLDNVIAEPTGSARFAPNDLPPPPKNLFAKEPGTGAYRAIEPAAASTRTPDGPAKHPSSEGRYGITRPTAIFGPTRPSQGPPPPSLFSDEVISDKSLDEVILSFLAEDLEPSRNKK